MVFVKKNALNLQLNRALCESFSCGIPLIYLYVKLNDLSS